MECYEAEVLPSFYYIREEATKFHIDDDHNELVFEKEELTPDFKKMLRFIEDNYCKIIQCTNPSCKKSGMLIIQMSDHMEKAVIRSLEYGVKHVIPQNYN